VFWDTLIRPDGNIAAFQGTIDSSGFGKYINNNIIIFNIYGILGLKFIGNIVLNKNFVPRSNNKIYYSDPLDNANIISFIYKIFQALSGSGFAFFNIA
jgi:hypothetical protein